MKRIVPFILCILIVLTLFCCEKGTFGYEKYTSIDVYHKIFELTELRFAENALELFPKEIENLEVENFYCEWELGIVGSARAEIELSVSYTEMDFDKEVERLKGLAGNKAVYDSENFKYPAYVTLLGYKHTNYYALVNAQDCSVHYVLLQLINTEDIDINKDLLPAGYGEFGEVNNISYNVYKQS